MPEFHNATPSELRQIYDLAPVGIGAIDCDLRFLRVNRRLAEINGKPADEHRGLSIRDIAPAMSTQLEPTLRAIIDGDRRNGEVLIQSTGAESEHKVWRFRASALANGNAVGGVIVVVDEAIDVDELRRGAARQRLEYAHLANAIPMIFLSARPDGVIEYSNTRWHDLVGDRTVRQLADVAHPGDTETVAGLLLADADGAMQPTFCEARLKDARGTYRWYLIEAQPIDAGHADDFHWYVTCADIEKQKRTENKLRRRTEVLIAEDRRKDEFLAVLGHEIRNPVAAMESAVTALTDGDEELADWSLDVLRSQLTQVTSLVNDLLDDARIRQGKITLKRETVDVASLMAVSAEGLRKQAEEKSIDFILDLPERPVAVEADRSRLEQVVSNLVANAVRYTDPGGSIRVSAEARGDDLHLSVADDGVGIHADRLTAIFEPFVQLANDQPGEREGLGVGLSLAKRIVQLHGGYISAHSEGEGQGSRFEVTLPGAVRSAAGQISVANTSGTGRWRRADPLTRSILLVDDNEPALLGLKRLLEAAGCEVITALTGKGAWQAFDAEAIDIAILDIGLPDISGHELARAFRRASSEIDRSLILIALTGYGHARARREAQAAGFDHHLLKPVDFSQLVQLIRD